MLATTTTSERIDPWIRMRRSLARFSGPGASNRSLSWADSIITAPGFKFLVHTALEELGLTQVKLIAALAAFNCGVEIGQVLIVATAFALLSAVDRWQISGTSGPVRNPALVHAVSFAIFLLGSYWFVSRTVAS